MSSKSDIDRTLRALLQTCRTLAVVGLSPRPDRPSHEVAEYLQAHGYRIVPVNPAAAGQQILGEHVYATLREADAALRAQSQVIDLVDVFRKSEDVLPIADEAVSIHAQCLWLQLGVVNDAALARAHAAGLAAVQNRCLKIDHQRLMMAG